MAGDVTLRGRLGRDPELRFTQTGKPVASLSVVTDRRQKDADGNWADTTNFNHVDLPVVALLAKEAEAFIRTRRDVSPTN